MARKFIRDKNGRFGFGSKKDMAAGRLEVAQARAEEAAKKRKPVVKKAKPKPKPKPKPKKKRTPKPKTTRKRRRRAQ